MPTVPGLSRQQVATNPLTPVRQPVESFDAASGVLGAAAKISNRFDQIREEEQQRAAEVRVNDADVRARRLESALLYDPKEGALFQTGLNAAPAMNKAMERLQQGLGEIERGLSSERERTLFQNVRARLEANIDRQLMTHVGREERAADTASHEALTASELDDIATHADDADWVDAAVGRLRRAEQLYADRTGLAPEVVERRVEVVTSAARARQIQRLADDGDIAAADAMLERYGDELLDKDREAVKRTRDAGAVLAASAAEEARILEAYPDDRRAALAVARAIEDVPTRDRTVQRLLTRFSQDEAVKRAGEQELGDRLFSQLERGGGDLSALNATDWAAAADVRGLREALERRATQVREGVEPATDWTLWTDISEMSAEELRKANPALWRPYLSHALYNEAIDRRASALGTGGRAGRDVQMSMAEVDKTLLGRMRELGLVGKNVLRPAQLKGSLGDDYGRVRQAVATALAEARTAKGNPLNPEEVRDALNGVLYDRVLQDGGLFGRDRVVPRAFVGPDDRARALTPEELRQRLPPGMPALTPGTSRADRWEELVDAGMPPAAATAQVEAELPN